MAWIFEPKDVKDALKAFTREIAGPKAKSLGWTFVPDEDHIQRQFKAVQSSITAKLIDRSLRLEWPALLMCQSIAPHTKTP